MTYDTTATRTWTRLSDNDGLVFDVEYRRIDANISEMMDGLAKAVDYTILAADNIGLIRATNSLTKTAGQAFSAATPSVVSDLAHGLVTGDGITVSASSAEDEIGNIHYIVTRINDDTFSLDGTVNAGGGGGTLDWRKDLVITLPAAASHTDNFYTVEKVDANEGAVNATDGSNEYFLERQGDKITLKSDGTNWIVEATYIRALVVPDFKKVRSYTVDDTDNSLNIQARFPAGGAAAAVYIPELPQNTISITAAYKGVNTVGITFGAHFKSAVGSANPSDIDIRVTNTGGTGNISGTVKILTLGNSFYLTMDANCDFSNGFRIISFEVEDEY